MKEYARGKIADYSIAAMDETAPVSTLSGGNQQKIVVARELTENCRLLVAAQPTRGVDVASADYIQTRILEAAKRGCAVLLISSDLDELIKISDRIMVINDMRIAQLDTPYQIYHHPADAFVKRFVVDHLDMKVKSIEDSIQ